MREVQVQRATARLEGDDTLRILTADRFRLFADRLMISGGMITDLVNRAFVAAPETTSHEWVWINDWSAHLDTMLALGMADVASTWTKPTCAEGSTAMACTDLVYSEPLFEMLILLFTNSANPLAYASLDDLAGKRLCRPKGNDLSGGTGFAGRDWLPDLNVRIYQPETAVECFDRLMAGDVDAVAINEFTGRAYISDNDMDGKIQIVQGRPLSIESLHVVTHRNNPRAEAIIADFDIGLETLRARGEYQDVIDTHMSVIWAGF